MFLGRKQSLGGLCSLLVAWATTGCTSDAVTPPRDANPWRHGVQIEAEITESGDAEAGRTMLLEGSYMTCGIPMKLWELGGSVIAKTLGGDKSDPTIPGRSGNNADLPYSLTAFTTPNGVDVVNANCLMCHGGKANGELVIGLGNATANFTGDPSESQGISPDLIDSFDLSDAEKAQFDMMQNRSAAIADYAVMRTLGNNPAEGLAIALMLHHDRDTLAWSDEPLAEFDIKDHQGQPIADAVLTSDPPPW
jgi:hypothetical protein